MNQPADAVRVLPHRPYPSASPSPTSGCPPLAKAPIPARGIDAEDAADVVAVAGDGELAEGVPPLVEEAAYRLADFILAVLRVVTCTGDGVDGPSRERVGLVPDEDGFEVGDGFLGVLAW